MPTLYVYLSDELHEQVEQIAAAEDRSLTVVTQRLVKEALAARKDAEQAEEDTHG